MKKILFVLVSLVMTMSVFAQDYMSNKWHVYIDGGMGAIVHKSTKYDCGAVFVGGSITVGYQVTNFMNIGLGSDPIGAIDSWGIGGKKPYEIPVYAQVRFDEMNEKIAPYIQFRFGEAFGEHNSKAFHLNIGAGIRIRHFTIGGEFIGDINHGSVGIAMGKIGLVFN